MATDKQENNNRKKSNENDLDNSNENQDLRSKENVEKEQDQNNAQDKNVKWDQAQRRQQASPRGYGENVDSQNTGKQNTLADEEQIDQQAHSENPNDPKKMGDQISQRQQTIDEGDAPENKKENEQ